MSHKQPIFELQSNDPEYIIVSARFYGMFESQAQALCNAYPWLEFMTIDGLIADCIWPDYSYFILYHEDELDDDFYELFSNNPKLLLIDCLPSSTKSTAKFQQLKDMLNRKKKRISVPNDVIQAQHHGANKNNESDCVPFIETPSMNFLTLLNRILDQRIGGGLIEMSWIDFWISTVGFTRCHLSHYQQTAAVADLGPSVNASKTLTHDETFTSRLILLHTCTAELSMQDITRLHKAFSVDLSEKQLVLICNTKTQQPLLHNELWVIDYR